MIAKCPDYIKSVVKLTIDTGMRRGEILKLTWGMIDLKEWGIRLIPEICKTKEGRFVPLNLALVEMFKAMPRGLPGYPYSPTKANPLLVQQSGWVLR